MITKCEVCHNIYGKWRLHCPTCGTFTDGVENFNMHPDVLGTCKLYPIIAAKGCERQYATHAHVFIDFSTVDPENWLGIRL